MCTPSCPTFDQRKLDQKQLHLQVNFVAYTSKRIDKMAFQSLYILKIIFLCRKMLSRPWEAPLELLAIFSKQLAKYPLHYWEPWTSYGVGLRLQMYACLLASCVYPTWMNTKYVTPLVNIPSIKQNIPFWNTATNFHSSAICENFRLDWCQGKIFINCDDLWSLKKMDRMLKKWSLLITTLKKSFNPSTLRID